jgi:hypothetical protein
MRAKLDKEMYMDWFMSLKLTVQLGMLLDSLLLLAFLVYKFFIKPDSLVKSDIILIVAGFLLVLVEYFAHYAGLLIIVLICVSAGYVASELSSTIKKKQV